VGNHDSVVNRWEVLTDDEAIDAAIDKYGKDPTTSVAYCAFATLDDRGPEHRFWVAPFQSGSCRLGVALASLSKLLAGTSESGIITVTSHVRLKNRFLKAYLE